jgi:molybdate transport system substrate-binding protein
MNLMISDRILTMKTQRTKSLILAITFAFLPRIHAADIQVFAAASLTDALREIGLDYEKQSGDRMVINFGASSTLARQIEEGAPADIFFSADEAKMNALEKNGRLLPGTRKSRLSNSLVLVVAADSSLTLRSMADLTNAVVKRVALADPKAVPAGLYAKAHLEKLRLWPMVEPKVVPTENVRGALAAVESGNVEAAIVYKTDAGVSKRVRIAREVPPSEGPDISYPMAIVKETKQPDAARRCLAHLESDAATRVFEKFGFIIRK